MAGVVRQGALLAHFCSIRHLSGEELIYGYVE